MIRKFIKVVITPSQKPIVEDVDLYAKIVELENRIADLECEILRHQIVFMNYSNHIEAVDARIDILSVEAFTKNV